MAGGYEKSSHCRQIARRWIALLCEGSTAWQRVATRNRSHCRLDLPLGSGGYQLELAAFEEIVDQLRGLLLEQYTRVKAGYDCRMLDERETRAFMADDEVARRQDDSNFVVGSQRLGKPVSKAVWAVADLDQGLAEPTQCADKTRRYMRALIGWTQQHNSPQFVETFSQQGLADNQRAHAVRHDMDFGYLGRLLKLCELRAQYLGMAANIAKQAAIAPVEGPISLMPQSPR